MQPTYLPWLGYLALMDRVDIFVFLDSVAFDRRSWQQRNRIKNANGIQTLTVPVFKKGLRGQTIAEVRINPEFGFPEKHIRSIEAAYGKAPFFDHYAPGLFAHMAHRREFLSDLTIDLIEWIADQFGITTRRMRSSSMKASGKKADLLVEICRELHANSYISPPGSRVYLDESSVFQNQGIDVSYSEYVHPDYPQRHGDFVPKLSAVDLLFNVGPNSLEVLRQGIC